LSVGDLPASDIPSIKGMRRMMRTIGAMAVRATATAPRGVDSCSVVQCSVVQCSAVQCSG
jgi:hypothetical protein